MSKKILNQTTRLRTLTYISELDKTHEKWKSNG